MLKKHSISALGWKHLDWGVLAALLMALPLIIPFLHSGMTVSADAQVNIHRTVSAAVNLDAGIIFPRWSPYLHRGFGYPIHNFYAPGIHILGAWLMRLFALDAVDAYKVLQAFFTLLQPVGAYLFARTFVGKAGALAGAAAFIYAPFRFDALWTQGNVPQLAAMGLLPWLFWVVHRAAQTRRLAWAGLTALLFGAIVLIHHASGFLIAPFVGLYAVVIAAIETRPFNLRHVIRPVFLTAGGLLLGLCISAIFWLPALAEFQYVNINRVQEGIFSITANFVPLDVLLGQTAPVDRTQLNPARFFSVGMVQAIAAASGLLVALLWMRRRTSVIANAALGFGFLLLTTFLMTPTSTLVWTTIPIASLVVYPWRLLGIASFGTIAGAAIVPYAFAPRWQAWAAGAVMLVMFAAALPMLYAPLYPYDTAPSTPAEGVRYERSSGTFGMTSANEYLPIWVSTPPVTPKTEVSEALTWQIYPYLSEGTQASFTAQADCPRGVVCYDVSAPDSFTFRFQQMYFPGWAAELDGEPVQVRPEGQYGLITLDMPAGTHTLHLWYEGTPIQKVGTWLSLIAIGVALAMLAWPRGSSTVAPVQRPSPEPGWPRLAQITAVVSVGFVLVNQLWIVPSTTLFRPQSDLTNTPIQTPVNLVFGESIELLGYTLETPSVAPGGTVVLRLHWHMLKPVDRELRAIVKLLDSDQQIEWASGGTPNIAEINTRTWPTDRYGVDLYRLHVSTQARPSIGRLHVAVYDVTDNKVWPLTPLTLPDGATELSLAAVRITGDYQVFEPGALDGQPVLFGDVIRLAGWQLRSTGAGEVCLDARWHAEADEIPDLALMLHTRQTADASEEVFDAIPFAGTYFTSQWVKGQTLDDTYCFTPPPTADLLEVALYRRADGERLSALQNGMALTHNILSLTLP